MAAGLAALGYIGYQSMTAEPAAEPDPVTTVEPSAPLVAPINDASTVVEQINDNATEAEILAELDLDPTGSDIAGD